LIDENDNWVISDFGQAVFRDTVDSSSRVVNIGGTDAYAPPEIDNLDDEFTRRYDIWSLGCIILEVAAFVVLGYDGLTGGSAYDGLDQVRNTQAVRSRRRDNRFFCGDGAHDCKLKDGIIRFMQQLQSADRLRRSPKSQIFIDRIVDLVGKMLAPSAGDRIDIGEVIRSLRFAVEDSNDNTQPFEMIPVPGERSILEPDLSSIRYVLAWLSFSCLRLEALYLLRHLTVFGTGEASAGHRLLFESSKTNTEIYGHVRLRIEC
jgi:serine/threonine protein kinase